MLSKNAMNIYHYSDFYDIQSFKKKKPVVKSTAVWKKTMPSR